MGFDEKYSIWLAQQRKANPTYRAKCKTCGFFMADRMHGWYFEDTGNKIAGITCDSMTGSAPLGNRRKSIIAGFNDSEDPAPASVAKKSCECGVWMTGGNHSGWCPDARRQHG